jgi:signal transduction histidine kinase
MRLRPGLWAALDYAVALLCAVIIFGALFKDGRYPFQGDVLSARTWLPLVLALCLAIPVVIRRRRPMWALVMSLTASVMVLALSGPVPGNGPFLPLALVLYVVAATCRRAVAVAGLAASLAVMAVQGLLLRLDGRGAGDAGALSLVLAICWTAGYAVQQRRAYVAHLADQVATSAVTQERLRIARELHDVVAHSMTVVAVQAGFGEYVFDSQPGEARAALGAIQTVSREALSDMQRLLGVLRQAAAADTAGTAGTTSTMETGSTAGPGSTAGKAGIAGTGSAAGVAGARDGRPGDARARALAPLAPAPGLADLERLVARTAGAGVRVAVERTGRVRDIPAGIDLSAYRIVQESLTNVARHAGSATATVRLGHQPGGVSVEVLDDGRAGGIGGGGTGSGIAGMTERAIALGGRLTAGPRPGGGFAVTAWLPIPAGAESAGREETVNAPGGTP